MKRLSGGVFNVFCPLQRHQIGSSRRDCLPQWQYKGKAAKEKPFLYRYLRRRDPVRSRAGKSTGHLQTETAADDVRP